MPARDGIYLITENSSDFGRYSSQEYQALVRFLREEALTHTSYEDLKIALAQALETTVELWAVGSVTYIGVEMILGTTSLPFIVPEWRRVYHLITLPIGSPAIPQGAVLIKHWQPLPEGQSEHMRQELYGERGNVET